MRLLAEDEWDGNIECRFRCVQWAIDSKDFVYADTIVDEAFLSRHPFQARTMRAWILCESGDLDKAISEAKLAVEESTQSPVREELRLLSRILLTLEDDANAIVLLKRIAIPGILDDNMKALIACGQRLGQHDLLLRLCSELREVGSIDEKLSKLEVQLLSRYQPSQAFELAGELMKTAEKPWYFLAYKNWLAVRLHRIDRLDMDPAKLPTPDQISPDEAPLVLMPFVALGRHSDALRFLYAQLRLNFEEESVHARYLYYFLNHRSQTNLCFPPAAADRNSAVLLRSDETNQQWVTIEDDSPLSSRGEFSSSSVLGQALVGKGKDDSVVMASGLVGQMTASIVEIQTKYVRAFQDCMANFVRRFPGSSVLTEIKASGFQDFVQTTLAKSLEDRRRHVDDCIEKYRIHICSMHLFAELIGASELDAMELLTQHTNGLVKSWETTPRDFEREASSGLPTDTVLLSISAISTLILCDGWRFLDSPKRFLVSQLTSELIDEWLYGVSGDMSAGEGNVHLDSDGQLVFHRNTEAEQTSRRNRLFAARKWLDEHAEKLPSSGMVEIPAEARSLYEECIGLHNLESINIAKEQGAVLWCDDMVVGIAAKADFEVPIAWTQLVMRCLAGSTLLTMEDFDLITAKLAAWRYVSIIWTPATIVAAAREADWHVNVWPLSEFMSVIRQAEIPFSGKRGMIAEVLKRIRKSDCSELRQTAVIQAILDAFGDINAVRVILQQLDLLFGVDIRSAVFIRFELQYWLRLR